MHVGGKADTIVTAKGDPNTIPWSGINYISIIIYCAGFTIIKSIILTNLTTSARMDDLWTDANGGVDLFSTILLGSTRTLFWTIWAIKVLTDTNVDAITSCVIVNASATGLVVILMQVDIDYHERLTLDPLDKGNTSLMAIDCTCAMTIDYSGYLYTKMWSQGVVKTYGEIECYSVGGLISIG